jgi:Ser/Thr protein kinase RdoA (MazF antagonist)
MDDPKKILEEVKPSLQQWNIQAKEIELVSHSENIVYKVIAEDQRQYTFRVHRPGYHTLAELNSEQTWTSALSDFGINVPLSYTTDNGEYYVAASCGGSVRHLGLIEWKEGKPLASHLPDNDDDSSLFPLSSAADIGEICARLHNQATTWQLPSDFSRHSLNLEGFVGEQPFWGRFWEASCLTAGEQKTISRLRHMVAERLDTYGQPADTYSMIHADLHQHNLLVTNSELVVIDFDDAGFGWHQYDLAVALFHFAHRADYESIYAACIEGYLKHRFISEEDLSMIPLFMLIRSLALIGWANARPELRHDDYLAYLVDRACSYRE